MRFYNLHERLEKLCRNIGFDLVEGLYIDIFAFLSNYSCVGVRENEFDCILENSDLERVVQPAQLWGNYLAFKNCLSEAHGRFPPKKVRENLVPMLVDIILTENQLLLLGSYPNEINDRYPAYSLPRLEQDMRKCLAIHEYQVAAEIQDYKTRLFLSEAYLRNYRISRPSKRDFLRRTVVVLCSVIIERINLGIAVSDEYVNKTLNEMGKAIRYANSHKIGLHKKPIFLLHKELEGIGSPHADRAFGLLKSIKYQYMGSGLS